MKNDLLVALLNQYIKNNNPPDELSREKSKNILIIRFYWDSGYFRDFSYTEERYIATRSLLAHYWATH